MGAFATETCYGLGGHALLAEAAEEVYRLKGRQRDKPLLTLIDTPERAAEWAQPLSCRVRALIQHFWWQSEGVLTLVFAASGRAPGHLVSAQGKIAMRCSWHPVVCALIALAGAPIIGTSANRSGQPPLYRAEAVQQALSPAWIASHASQAAQTTPASTPVPPSTVVDVSQENWQLLRPGGVAAEALDAIWHSVG